MTSSTIGKLHATPELIPLLGKEKQDLREISSRPTYSYQDQAEITSSSQKERLINAHKNAAARKLWNQAAQLFAPQANSDPAAFRTTSSSWEENAVKEIAATYIAELKNRDQKIFDSVALAKAIALIEHERDFIRDPQSSAVASRENIFPEIKDKKEALNEAITELFKAVNQADKDEALASFKNVGSGYLNEHFSIVVKNSAKAIGVAGSTWNYFIKNPVKAVEEKVDRIEEDVQRIDAGVKRVEEAVKGGKEGVTELVKELAKEAVKAAATKALATLSEFVGGVPTAEAISAAINVLGLAGGHYLAHKASENQYFNGAEELAPTVVPKMTPSIEDAKDLLTASLATKNLLDANEVQARLIESTEDGKDILAKERRGDAKITPLQLIQRDINTKNKVIKTLKSALQDGERVLQAEQDFKNASRNEKITGPGSKQRLVRGAQRGICLASMIGTLGGAGPVAPAAALLITNLIHLAYHFGGGSIADGEEKMMNTLESALKSDDLIDTNQISRRQIANLYGEYSAAAKKYGEESPEELAARQTLKKALDGKINIDIVNNILQQPVSIRLENGKKLFEGQIAKTVDQVQRVEENRSKKTLTEKDEALINEMREKLQLNLADFAKFHTAISGINEAMQHENEEQREAALTKAYEQSTQLLGEIKNEDFHRLFTGTLKKQLGALNKANREYVDMTPKKNESAETAKLKMLQVNPRLTEAAATFDIVLKGDTFSEIDEATLDQLITHGAVPKALNFSLLKLDGNKESVEVLLTNTAGYYKKHHRIRTRDEKGEILKAKANNHKNTFANSLFGTPAKALAVHLCMKKTRDARHNLPDDVLEGRSVLKELEAPDKNPFSAKSAPFKAA